MRKLILPFVFVFLNDAAVAQTHPCSDTVYRQFDFWLGEWEVFNINGKKAGDSKISRLLNDCVIKEEWTSASVQKGIRYAGTSYNSYNKGLQSWQQYWVDNAGGVSAYTKGYFAENKMILETANTRQADSSFKIQKMTFYKTGKGTVRQFGESSADGGKTWVTDFDLEYRRKK